MNKLVEIQEDQKNLIKTLLDIERERDILGQLSATSLKQSQRFELCKELDDLYIRRSLLST